MEEQDRQILEACRELQCSFYTPDLHSLEQLSRNELVEFLTRCLWLISPPTRAFISSYKLSTCASERFQTTTTLANSLMKFNVRGKFGYQTLLYGSTAELRQIFIAVYEKIPKEISTHLRQSLLRPAEKLLESGSVWILRFSSPWTWEKGLHWTSFHDRLDVFSIALLGTLRHDRALHNTEKALLRSSGFESQTSANVHATSSPILERRDSQSSYGQVNAEEVSCQPPTRTAQPSVDQTRLSEVLHILQKKQELLTKENDDITNKRLKTVSILKRLALNDFEVLDFLDSSVLKAELQSFFDSGSTRARTLEFDVQNSKQELLCQLKKVKNRELRAKQRLRGRFVSLLGQYQAIHSLFKRKTAIADKKERHLKAAGDSVGDMRFIARLIKDAIGNVQKQNDDIDKIHGENMAIQRELKWTSQTLHRISTRIDEVLFEEVDDRKGERACQLFGRLNATCMNSVEAMKHNSMIARQKVELIDLIEIGKQHQFAQQLNRIRKDLEMVLEDNRELSNSLSKRLPENHFVPLMQTSRAKS
ncbi:hypothetical protein GCK32_000584 [Trichostrongylus colubriformis]|uniref:CCDC22 N-terminal domain-containing protein n=1 Tax=Trichostrongylus colubriformis TaxID=6319 RepID=A0AAN8F8E5_TRICO